MRVGEATCEFSCLCPRTYRLKSLFKVEVEMEGKDLYCNKKGCTLATQRTSDREKVKIHQQEIPLENKTGLVFLEEDTVCASWP